MKKVIVAALSALTFLLLVGIVAFPIIQNTSTTNTLNKEGVTHTVEVLEKGNKMKRAGRVYTMSETATFILGDQVHKVTLPNRVDVEVGETFTVCVAGEIIKVDYADCAN